MNIQLNNKFRVLVVGVVLPSMGSSQASTLYVAPSSANPMPPYTNWATASPTIQQAIDAAAPGDELVVTNGIYATGGRNVPGSTNLILTWTNRVTVDKPLTLRSVNGSQFTVIQGDWSTRCAYLAAGASLSGFTLTNGHVQVGAGVLCESQAAVVSDCLIVSNSAWSVGGRGGGASGGALNRCTLVGNFAGSDFGGAGGGADSCALNDCRLVGNSSQYGGGGGAYGSTLNNCTLTGNSGRGVYRCVVNNSTLTGNSEGGAYLSTLNNSIVYFNTAPSQQEANYALSILNYCCTTPQPTDGLGNLTNAPLFLDQVGGNLRLQSNSPCINAGNNAYAPDGPDLDGNPRIVAGTVDIGAHEFQAPTSIISYAWLQHFGLPTDGSADFIDSDGDGMNNWQEWRCGTDPTNALSVLRLVSASTSGAIVMVSWESVAGVNYVVERSTNFGIGATIFTPLTNLAGQPTITTYTDMKFGGSGPVLYRVGVR
jgi:hypothetical protein